MARWPVPRGYYEPLRVEVEISPEGTEIERSYAGSEGIQFVDCRTFSRASRWPAPPVKLGGHHSWFVGGHVPTTETDELPDVGED
jgi:hypothetical protein